MTQKLLYFVFLCALTSSVCMGGIRDNGKFGTDSVVTETDDNAAWVPGLRSHLACANTVFAIPGKPFMHKIRVPENESQTAHAVVPVKTGVRRVYNLPEGLTWNVGRCLVEGIAPAAGDYMYSVEFEVGDSIYQEGIKLHVSDSLSSPTPMMGWQSWNVLKNNISDEIIRKQADRFVSLGLREAGYRYIGIDDCWQVKYGRDPQTGRQIPDPKLFPDGMKAVTDYIHGLGLKAGIYSDCGTVTCEGYEASFDHEATDAKAYADWGFDMLKEDWFWDGHGVPDGFSPDSNEGAYTLYKRMGDGIIAGGRDIILYMCEWGIHDPWKWAPEVGASCWRMSYDARDGWWGETAGSRNNDNNANGIGVHNTIVLMRNLWPYVGINRFNDADMLCVGIRGTGQSSNDCVYGVRHIGDAYYTGDSSERKIYTGMNDVEYETNFAMWSMYGSPLLLSIDMCRNDLNPHDLALMKNSELIAINQDSLGQGAEYIKSDGNLDYYQKDLADGDVAIAVVNLGDSDCIYSITIEDYDALIPTESYNVRDLIRRKNAGVFTASAPLTGNVSAHGTYIIRLTKR